MRNCVNVWCPDELINDYCQDLMGSIRDFQHCNKRWFTFFHRLQIDSVAAFTTNDHLDGTEDTVKLVVRGGGFSTVEHRFSGIAFSRGINRSLSLQTVLRQFFPPTSFFFSGFFLSFVILVDNKIRLGTLFSY